MAIMDKTVRLYWLVFTPTPKILVWGFTAIAVIGLSLFAGSPAGSSAVVGLTEHKIPGIDYGIELYLREKAPADRQDFSKDDVVLLLEPFSIPSAEAFDVPGYSWMEDLAKDGYDVWALDFRGFGKSTRPAAMEKPPLENPPVVRAAEAIKDVEAAVEYIRKTRKVDRVNIIGWSWGAVIGGMYAVGHPEKVNKLVLYGAMHGFSLPSMVEPLEERPGVLNSKLPAYQLATFDMTLHHWHTMMNGHELARKEAFEAVGRVFMESDPTSRSRQPNSIRRPVGPLIDLYYIWNNKPIFDAGKIKAPVLVIRGDADFFADPTLFGKLTGAGGKKEIIIKDATHWVLYEKNRSQLIWETTLFLKTK